MKRAEYNAQLAQHNTSFKMLQLNFKYICGVFVFDFSKLPDCLRCGSYRQRLQGAELWMSSGGTASLLHSHDDHNLHCVLFGRKDFIIIERMYKDSFDYRDKVSKYMKRMTEIIFI